MRNLSAFCVLALLLAAVPAQAGNVFRCVGQGGKVYYSDKTCDAGDQAVESKGGGSVTIIDGGAKPKGKSAAAKKQNAGGQSSTKSRYIKRAEKTSK